MKKKVEFKSEEKDYITSHLQNEIHDYVYSMDRLLNFIHKINDGEKLSDAERMILLGELSLEEMKDNLTQTEESIYNKLKD